MTSNTGKIKFYKNPSRTNEVSKYSPYIPQYKVKCILPENHMTASNISAQLAEAASAEDNPRLPRPVIRQDYSEPIPSPVGVGRGQLPNVGNNIEQSWPNFDGSIEDDLNLDCPMVDNNEFVTDAALGIHNSPNMVKENTSNVNPVFPVNDSPLNEMKEIG